LLDGYSSLWAKIIHIQNIDYHVSVELLGTVPWCERFTVPLGNDRDTFKLSLIERVHYRVLIGEIVVESRDVYITIVGHSVRV
jgi:hypothetical protein